MQNLFRSRRRKLGLVVLALALILTGGWIRSFGTADIVEIQGEVLGNQKARFALISARRGVYLQKIEDQFYPLSPVEWNTVDADGFDAQRDLYCDLNWQFDCLGFHADQGRFGTPPGRHGIVQTWIIAYWLVVIPLTIISAYLLISPSLWKQTTDAPLLVETTP